MEFCDTLRSVGNDGVVLGGERDWFMWDSESNQILEDIANECLREVLADACLRSVVFHLGRRK